MSCGASEAPRPGTDPRGALLQDALAHLSHAMHESNGLTKSTPARSSTYRPSVSKKFNLLVVPSSLGGHRQTCRASRQLPCVSSPGFRVKGSGSRVQGPGFRVQGPGLRVQGSGPVARCFSFRFLPLILLQVWIAAKTLFSINPACQLEKSQWT